MNKFGAWANSNPTIIIGFFVFGALLIGGMLLRKQTMPTGQQVQDLSGLATDANGNHVVYVPTSTQFTSTVVTDSNNTVSYPVTVPVAPIPAPTPHPKPVPTPNPKPPVQTPVQTPVRNPPTSAPVYGLVWGAIHVVSTDDTNHGSGALAYIASRSTAIMQTTQGMPRNKSISASDIKAHNPGLTDNLKLGQKIFLPSWERIR